MKKSLSVLSSLLFSLPAFSAIPIDLSLQTSAFLTRHAGISLQETSRAADFNHTLHIRTVQTYQGHPVWGGDAVIHVPQGKSSFMNGIVYQNLAGDLNHVSSAAFTQKQMQTAISHVFNTHKSKISTHASLKDQQGKLIVYVDNHHKAHWAYHIQFFVPGYANVLPQRPNYIVDAETFSVYQQWNEVKTQDDKLDEVKAGGFAGNHKTGKKILDGLKGHPSSLDMQRNRKKRQCFMQNKNLALSDYRTQRIMMFNCIKPDSNHNNIYWNANHDQVDTTWSPSNDVMFGLEVTRNMFNDWYQMPMLEKDGKPMFVQVIVHDPIENAYWDGIHAVFGDSVGSDMFNPFTQLDTVSHEICHGFTEQHSGLVYYGHAGGMNEAFSDIAGMAAEYYAYGSTQFLIGLGDVKAEGKALRYMDKPSKDCEGGGVPGRTCSIDNAYQFPESASIDPHYGSGVYNRFYYNLANTADWNARKAFDVMIQANVHYWTATSNFHDAACGVMQAAQDYKYDLTAVSNAFKVVGIDTSDCQIK